MSFELELRDSPRLVSTLYIHVSLYKLPSASPRVSKRAYETHTCSRSSLELFLHDLQSERVEYRSSIPLVVLSHKVRRHVPKTSSISPDPKRQAKKEGTHFSPVFLRSSALFL